MQIPTQIKLKVKVSHSLIAVGAVGGGGGSTVSWAQLMKGEAHPSPWGGGGRGGGRVPLYLGHS